MPTGGGVHTISSKRVILDFPRTVCVERIDKLILASGRRSIKYATSRNIVVNDHMALLRNGALLVCSTQGQGDKNNLINGGGKLLRRATLCEQIYTILARRINSGEIPESTFLPSEYDLAREFKVSIGTVRKAVEQLVRERLLVRKRGKGTVVCNQKWIEERDRIQHIRFGESMDIGLWTYQELDYQIIQADSNIASKLGIRVADDVHHIHRIRKTSSTEIILEKAYTPVALYPDFMPDSAGRRDAIGAAERNGHTIGTVDIRVTALAASEQEATLMNISVASPLLEMNRILYNTNNTIIEHRVAHCYLESGYFWSRFEPDFFRV